ncbi:MAG: LptF/LptG family permease [Balneolaceae bacterium]
MAAIIKKIDRYILFKLLTITVFVMFLLIFIFILIDFSENSDDFADKGATMSQIWNQYYLNYIPEMMRLVSPVAVLVACLFLAGQMTERLEIIALKAAGVSLYRLIIPFLFFGTMVGVTISYLDAFIIPMSNAERIDFEKRFLTKRTDRIDRGGLYRQESENTIFNVNFFDPYSNTAYRTTLVEFENNQLKRITTASRMQWNDSTNVWEMQSFEERIFNEDGIIINKEARKDTVFNVQPRDLARRTSDIYQLTYPDAMQYINSMERIGAGGINLPLVQLFSRMAYPISIIVVSIVGFAIASEKRSGGKGFYIAAGLGISFIYLAMMKVIEPFGAAGTISPHAAAIIPHGIFLVTGIILLLLAKK